MTTGSTANIRSLIDQHFSLQWCRENIVIPIDIRREISLPGESGKEVLIIFIANFHTSPQLVISLKSVLLPLVMNVK